MRRLHHGGRSDKTAFGIFLEWRGWLGICAELGLGAPEVRRPKRESFRSPLGWLVIGRCGLETHVPLVFELLEEEVDDFAGGLGDHCAWAEDGGGSVFVEEVVVLCGDDSSADDHDVFAA